MGRFLPKSTPGNRCPSWHKGAGTLMSTTSKFEPTIV